MNFVFFHYNVVVFQGLNSCAPYQHFSRCRSITFVVKMKYWLNLNVSLVYVFLLYCTTRYHDTTDSHDDWWNGNIMHKHNISIGSLCVSEDSHDISVSINFLVMFILMFIFSEDIVDISLKCSLIGWESYAYGLCLCLRLCQHVLTGHYSYINISISIRRTQGFDIVMLMLMSWPSSQAHKLLLC